MKNRIAEFNERMRKPVEFAPEGTEKSGLDHPAQVFSIFGFILAGVSLLLLVPDHPAELLGGLGVTLVASVPAYVGLPL